jgi:rod shape-determining protein MreC
MAVALSARSRPRPRPLVLVLLLLAVTIFAVDRAGNDAPTHAVRSAVRDGAASISGSLGAISPFKDTAHVKSLERQNADLKAKLDEANGKLATTSDAVRERDNLAQLLNLRTPGDVPKVIAQVTAVGASNFDSTMEIGKGSDDGIKTGMPVVTGTGLIGRVIQTTNARSTVLLITDTTFNVSVRLPNGDVAAAVGDGVGNAMRLDLVDLDNPLKEGDTIVTSGLDHSMYPAGLPVGTVKSLSAGPHDLRKNVRLAPATDLRTSGDVAVLKWTP